MPRISRFLKKSSDRSGFDGFRIQFVKDGPWIVAGEEKDAPPPSRFSLGGEGDLAGEARTSSSFAGVPAVVTDTAAGLGQLTTYVTAAGGITPTFTHPWMRVTGSNAAITISAVPNIVRGKQDQILTVECVDSAVTLTHGSANAVNLMGSLGALQLQSGMTVTFIYNTANQAWNEASRYRP